MARGSEVKKIVLAYSGGLDTSVMLHWLKEKYGCPILAFVADVGQGEDLPAIEKKAYETGADISSHFRPARGVRPRVLLPRHAGTRSLRG